MKLSKESTEWILAHTVKVFDIAHHYFILIHLEDGLKQQLTERLLKSIELANDPYYYQINFWQAPFGWYKICAITDPLLDQMLEEQNLWSYIHLDSEEELKSLTPTDEPITISRLELESSGYASYRGRGEYSNRLFHSADLPLIEILTHSSI